jgi:hypothetical protein
MANIVLSVQDQLKRLNLLKQQSKDLASTAIETLKRRPDEKSWSVIEVVEHMVLGHQPYRSKIDAAVNKLKASEDVQDQIKSRNLPSFLIKRFPPKDGKIRFKMKTMKPVQACS